MKRLMCIAALMLAAGCETVPDESRQTVSRSSCISNRYATTCRATGAGGVESRLSCQHGGGLTTCSRTTTVPRR